MSANFVKALDKAVQRYHQDHPEGRRGHLGASGVGARCARQTWYAFRWFYEVKHTGRILRLFSRGHEEEPRFARWLRMAGVEVRDYAQRLGYHPKTGKYVAVDWDMEIPPFAEGHCIDVSENPHHIALAKAGGFNLRQWGFKDHGGHFSGSSDGMIRGGLLTEVFGLTDWGKVECKTHSERSFKAVEKAGVLSSKSIHYSQMQLYMHYFKLKWCLYMAVNKNTDELYIELVPYREEIARSLVDVAYKIITSVGKPKRITEDPSWFECRFCDFREICFYDKAPNKNCRTCVFSSPTEGSSWYCGKYAGPIPVEFAPAGCEAWEPYP